LLYAEPCDQELESSALDPAREAALELAQVAELSQRFDVLFAAKGGGHAREVADRSD
jgi:hypothetical protein